MHKVTAKDIALEPKYYDVSAAVNELVTSCMDVHIAGTSRSMN